MLKISAGAKATSRAITHDTCDPDSDSSRNIDSRAHSDSRNIDRLLKIIGETAIAKNDPSEVETRELPSVEALPAVVAATEEEITLAEIDTLLRRSGVVAQDVRCDVGESEVILSGRVRRYHHLQIVLQIVMRCRAGRQIVNHIGVETNSNS